MNYKTVLLCISSLFGNDITNIIINYLRYFTNEPGCGCAVCKIAWNSLMEESLIPLKNSYKYPVVFWHIGYFDIGYTCSLKCQLKYYINNVIENEQEARKYITEIEEYRYNLQVNNFIIY